MSQSDLNSSTTRQLSSKISLLVFSFTIVISVISISIQALVQYQQAKEDTKRVFTDVKDSFIPTLEKSLWNVDDQQVQIILTGIIELKDIGALRLERKTSDPIYLSNSSVENLFQEEDFVLEYQINGQTFNLGTLHISLTDEQIKADLIDEIWLLGVSTVFTLFIVAILLIQIFKSLVSKHLIQMKNYAQGLDSKELHQPLQLERAPSPYADELDNLVDAINTMRVRIRSHIEARKQNESELELYKNDLERVVEQRTAELKLKSEMLESKSLELASQNQELDAYAHTVAHDLKQPINSLMGIITLLQDGSKEERSTIFDQSIDMIVGSAQKMQQIIESLLTLSVLRKSEIKNLEEIDSFKVAENAIARLNSFIENNKGQITIEPIDNWPTVVGKHQWIEEVWVNYLTNAIKYGGTPPKIWISFKEVDAKVRFEVTDNGKGIDINKEHVLYHAFNRLHDENFEGHGLGLSIVKRIIDKLNGTVGFESAKTGGTTFWFTLPKA